MTFKKADTRSPVVKKPYDRKFPKQKESVFPENSPIDLYMDVIHTKEQTVAAIDFQIGEIIWAKLKGYPHWPAKIKSFPNSKMAVVVWFNDYRVTKMYKAQLYKFLINFDNFSKKFDQTIGLRTAAQETLIYYGNTISKCWIKLFDDFKLKFFFFI